MSDPTHFPLAEARLCLDCHTVHNGTNGCPACDSKQSWPVSKWMELGKTTMTEIIREGLRKAIEHFEQYRPEDPASVATENGGRDDSG